MRYVLGRLLLSIFLFGSTLAQAQSDQSYQSISIDGTLYADPVLGTPLSDSAAVLIISIYDPGATCLLYEETQTVNTVASAGQFNIEIGSATGAGKRTGNDPNLEMYKIFQNFETITGFGACNYNPTAGDTRLVRITLDPSASGPVVMTPDLKLTNIPNALVCERVQDLNRSELLKIGADAHANATQANFMSLINGSDVGALHNHDGTYALLNNSGSITMGANQTIELGEVAGTPGGLVASDAGKMWIDTTDSNKVKFWDGTSVVDLTSGGGGTITSVFGRTTAAIAAATSDYDAVQVDNAASGNISATNVQAAIDELDSEKLALAGGTMSGAISMGSNLITNVTDPTNAQEAATKNYVDNAITTNNSSYVAKAGDSMTGALTLNTQNELRLADDAGGDYISFKAPAGMSSNFDYTLPPNYGTSGHVLTTDGAGVLTWQADDTGGGAGTLDQAYDQGGAGAGRAITVDTGAVQLTGSNAADETLEVTNSGNGGAALFENTGTGLSFRVNDEAADATPFVITDDGSVGIGTATPGASALLDVSSTSKGFLPPRMTTAQRTGVSSPAEGLVVFDTDEKNLYIYQNAAWAKMADTTEVAFRVHRSGSDITNNSVALVDWSTEDLDTGNFFDLAADRFQPTVAGYYFISFNGQARACTNGEYPQIAIHKNGAAVSSMTGEGNSASNMHVPLATSVIVQMNGTTDYIEGHAGDDGCGSSINGSSLRTHLEGFLISGGTGGGGSADHLGNHTATQNIQLGAHFLSNDGGASEGLSFDTSGNATFSGTITGDGSALTNIGASAIADNSITVADLDFASTNGINIPQLASAPGTPTAGQSYFNTTDNKLYFYNGSSWVEAGGNGAAGTVGMVASFPTATCPSGWLAADGSAVSRTTYASLFASISTMYGPGDGSTTFNLPDYRGQFLRGVDGGAGTDPDAAGRTDRGDGTTGDNVGTKQSHQLQNHKHSYDAANTYDSNTAGSGSLWRSTTSKNSSNPVTGNAGSETRPINVNVTYCISHSGGVTGGGFAADGSIAMSGNIRLNDNYLSNDGGNEGIRIDNSGNVGIGTATPGSALEVSGIITSGQAAGSPGFAFSGQQTTGLGLYSSNNLALYQGGSRVLNYFGSTIEYHFPMIGTTNGAHISPSGGALTTPVYSVRDNTSMGIGWDSASEKLSLITSDAARVVVDTSGNVGIGTTSPATTLDVNGQVKSGYLSHSSLNTNWNSGNIQTTSVAAGTLTFTSGSMHDGASYVLILTSAGTFTLSTAGDITTWRCQPACGSNQITATGHTILTILKAGSTGYVSWSAGY